MGQNTGTTGLKIEQSQGYPIGSPFQIMDEFRKAKAFGNFITGEESTEMKWLLDELSKDRANKWNEEMWEKQNKYNSTSEQLKRWIEAGGNPNAFFNGGQNVGNASSVTSASPGNAAAPPTTAEELGQMAEVTQKLWDVQKTKAETEQIKIDNGTRNEINQETINKLKQDIASGIAGENLTKAEQNQIDEMLPYLKGKTQAEIDIAKQQKNNLEEEYKQIQQNTKKAKWETRKTIAEAYSARWEAWYKMTYGIDPNAGWVNAIQQAILGVNDHYDNYVKWIYGITDKTLEMWDSIWSKDNEEKEEDPENEMWKKLHEKGAVIDKDSPYYQGDDNQK